MIRRLGYLAFAVSIVVLVLGAFALGLDSTDSIDYYRVVDPHTIVVGVGTCPSLWTRITTVEESDTEVSIGARSIRAPVPSICTDVAEFTIVLSSDLGNRQVLDSFDGVPVANCTATFPGPQWPICAEAP